MLLPHEYNTLTTILRDTAELRDIHLTHLNDEELHKLTSEISPHLQKHSSRKDLKEAFISKWLELRRKEHLFFIAHKAEMETSRNGRPPTYVALHKESYELLNKPAFLNLEFNSAPHGYTRCTVTVLLPDEVFEHEPPTAWR